MCLHIALHSLRRVAFFACHFAGRAARAWAAVNFCGGFEEGGLQNGGGVMGFRHIMRVSCAKLSVFAFLTVNLHGLFPGLSAAANAGGNPYTRQSGTLTEVNN